MKVTNLKTNRMTNPLGFSLEKPRLSFITCDTEAKEQTAARIVVALDEDFTDIIYDTGKSNDIDSLGFELPAALKPCTRYYWKVTVWGDNGDVATSEPAWFETAKRNQPWSAGWITPEFDKEIHPILSKEFTLDKEIKSARAYVCGLGLYEMNFNEQKAGDEFLTPYCNAYDKWLQYQTYDITDLLQPGQNDVEVMLGNGWYKGRFGFEGEEAELYGDQFALLCEIRVEFTDGTSTLICTDDSWKARKSKIKASNIYDGEVYDAAFDNSSHFDVEEIDLGFDRLQARLSLPVVIKEKIKPEKVINTPAGETVLDMGQNMVGWVQFKTDAPEGTEILLQHGEVLQEGNFYRENLRSAKAEFKYTADGKEKIVRPHFTFYGFRYVKITGWPGEVNPDDFTGCVLYSDMEHMGNIETDREPVNRLFLNALWGQKGNFLDVPTDCPQRDERMGWTGDAQVFSGTACFNMDSFAFFTKYGYDLWQEQKDRDGMVPMVIPAVNLDGGGSSAWGDAATIIPWNVYLHYGDNAILEQQFASMKAWVDYIKKCDEESGTERLWTTGFHFGDWLALDGDDPKSPMGGTETDYIASAYYCYSSRLVARAAEVLGKTELARKYSNLAAEVKQAIIDEYVTKNGRLAVSTQTAHVLALFMDLVQEKHRGRIADDLQERLKKDGYHLKTGFVGTPYLCRVLSENGYNDLAYTLLLNDDYPGWLYAVKMGATTIWERWNSLLPDGKISDTGMNSLNHYAYGSIVEWMYRNMAGINPTAEKPGFKHVQLTPQPDYRFKYVKASLNSAAGLYESQWSLSNEGDLHFEFNIPFNATADLVLPHADIDNVKINGKSLKTSELESGQQAEDVIVKLFAGTWEFDYTPTRNYIKYYSIETPIVKLLENEETKGILEEHFAQITSMPEERLENMKMTSLKELAEIPLFDIAGKNLNKLNKKLNEIRIPVK